MSSIWISRVSGGKGHEFFLNDPAAPYGYALSLHDALPICAVVGLVDDLLGILDRAGARDDGQDQSVLGVVGEVVPPVPLMVVGRVSSEEHLPVLQYAGPHVVDLDLAGLGGKRPRVLLE